jgi:hypothetical protein
MQYADDCRGFLHIAVNRRRPARVVVPDDKQPGCLRYSDGGVVGTAAVHGQHFRRRWLERGERAQ